MSADFRTVKAVEIESIARDTGVREVADPVVVAEYAAAVVGGKVFPPIVVFDDGSKCWLVDGLHRIEAHLQASRSKIVAEVRPGSRQDALWEACMANKLHGLRRSNADKRRSAIRALLHPKGSRLSDRQIASHCGVHHHTIGRIRRELEQSGEMQPFKGRLVRRGAAEYVLNIDGVSGANARRAAPALHASGAGQVPCARLPRGTPLHTACIDEPTRPQPTRDVDDDQTATAHLMRVSSLLAEVGLCLAHAGRSLALLPESERAVIRALAADVHRRLVAAQHELVALERATAKPLAVAMDDDESIGFSRTLHHDAVGAKPAPHQAIGQLAKGASL